MNCRNFVSSEGLLSGVHHRNHCPHCLSSRHLDLFKAGDRLSACKARMLPVALTLKRTSKKYPSENRGEIMLVHQCEGCGKISINRIAADDNAEILLEVFETSCSLKTREGFVDNPDHIDLLTPNDRRILQAQLFGQ
jgi:hypothetical protein